MSSSIRLSSPLSKTGICMYSGKFQVGEYKAFWVNAGVSDETRIRVTFFKDVTLGELKAGKELRKVLAGGPHNVALGIINPSILNLARKTGSAMPLTETKLTVVTSDADSITVDIDLMGEKIRKAFSNSFYSTTPNAAPKTEKVKAPKETQPSMAMTTVEKVHELKTIGHITLSAKVTLSELRRIFGNRSRITITDANDNMMDVDLT